MHTILYVNVNIHFNDRYIYIYIHIYIYRERERYTYNKANNFYMHTYNNTVYIHIYSTTRHTIFTCIHKTIQYCLFPHLPHYNYMGLHDRIMIVYKVFAIEVAHSLMQNL